MKTSKLYKKNPLGRTLKRKLQRPEPWILVNSGIFMLALYGSLTRLPSTLGFISLVSLMIAAAIGIFGFLWSVPVQDYFKESPGE